MIITPVRSLSTMNGHVIARLLNSVKPSKKKLQESHASRNPKPPHAHIDPGLLCPNTGHLRYRPQTRVLPQSAAWGDTLNIEGNATLDVYLYSQGNDGNEMPRPPLHLTMNRDSKESVSKTLARMELSLSKKLSERNRDSSVRKKLLSPPQLSTVSPVVCSVNNSSGDEPLEPWDITGMTNGELIKRALSKPCVIQLHTAPSDDEQCLLKLLVEACPPSITAVRCFEDFNSCLFVGVPICIFVETVFADGCNVDWYVLRGNAEPERVAVCQATFTPTPDLVGAHLAILLTPYSQQHEGRGQEEAYQFQLVVEVMPDNLVFQLRTPEWTNPPNSETLRVVSYNLLADQNAFQAGNQIPFYPYCSTEVLKRARRMPLLLHELLAYHSNIMCLQEVDQIVFDSLLRPTLSSLGYDGFYTMKQNAGTREGCATFWSTERFQEVDRKWFHLGELSNKLHVRPLADDWSSSLKTLDKLLKSHKSLKYVIKSQLGHIAQMVRLVDKQTNKHILVVNTHLFYHPDASHIRLIQMLLIARQISMELGCDGESRPHIILCGDLNSSLESAAGKLMVDRQVPENFRTLKQHLNTFDFGIPKATAAATTDFDFPLFELPDSFPILQSAMSEPPLFTHFIGGFSGCLDHILTTMETIRSAPMPTIDEATRNVAMPSEVFPSDHVSVVCDLKM